MTVGSPERKLSGDDDDNSNTAGVTEWDKRMQTN